MNLRMSILFFINELIKELYVNYTIIKRCERCAKIVPVVFSLTYITRTPAVMTSH
jgi:hypothetical protein